MKFRLFRNVPISNENWVSGRIEKKMQWDPKHIVALSPSNEPVTNHQGDDYKLVKWLQSNSLADLNRHVKLSICSVGYKSKGGKKRPIIKLFVQSSLFPDLHFEIHQGDMDENLKLTLIAVSADGENNNNSALKPSTLLNGCGNRSKHHIRYESKNDVKMPEEFFGSRPCLIMFDLLLEVGEHEYFPLRGILQSLLSVNRRLMMDEKSFDLSVIVKGGAKVQCHRLFLTTYSSRLHELIYIGRKTAPRPPSGKPLPVPTYDIIKDTIEMNWVSEGCFRALLEFIYCRDMTRIKRDSKIALELMRVAIKYGIEPLKISLVSLFMMKKDEWFDLDESLYLHLFLGKNKSKGMVEVKQKIREIIRSRKELLPGSVLVSDKKFGKDYWLDLLAAQGKAEQDH